MCGRHIFRKRKKQGQEYRCEQTGAQVGEPALFSELEKEGEKRNDRGAFPDFHRAHDGFLYLAVFAFDNVLEAGKKFDIGSFVISIFAFGGITLGIGNIGTYGWKSVQVLPVLVVGCVAAALFVYRQLHYKETFCNCVFDEGDLPGGTRI